MTDGGSAPTLRAFATDKVADALARGRRFFCYSLGNAPGFFALREDASQPDHAAGLDGQGCIIDLKMPGGIAAAIDAVMRVERHVAELQRRNLGSAVTRWRDVPGE